MSISWESPGGSPSLTRLARKMGNVKGVPLAHHIVPSSPTRADKQMPVPRGQQHRKTVTTTAEDIQQAHACDVKPGECGPRWPQKIQNLVQTHSVYDSKAEECIPDCLTKTGCGQRAPDYDTTPGGCTANCHIKPGNDWAPAQEGRLDTCWRPLPGTLSLPVSQGLCPDLTPVDHVMNDPYKLLWHPPHHTANKDPGCPEHLGLQIFNQVAGKI